MKAYLNYKKNGIHMGNYEKIEERPLHEEDVKVKLKTAGLNHRDLFVLGRLEEGQDPIVIGSDGAGIVEEVGANVSMFKPGDEVVINPSLRWDELSASAPAGFEILGGNPEIGTIAEKIIISSNQVERKPSHLTWEEAGVFPLSALTAYRALFTKAKLQKGETVFLPGIGSGTITFALLFAKAAGVKVIVSSRSEAKLQHARELGADMTVMNDSNWKEELKNETIDVVVESIGEATFARSLEILNDGGRLVSFGGTSGYNLNINLFEIFIRQISIFGTTMGSREEFREMLRFSGEHQIKPVIDKVYPIVETDEAIKRLDEGKQFGKIGIKIENDF